MVNSDYKGSDYKGSLVGADAGAAGGEGWLEPMQLSGLAGRHPLLVATHHEAEAETSSL